MDNGWQCTCSWINPLDAEMCENCWALRGELPKRVEFNPWVGE